MERTMRILARMFEQNGTLFIGATIAVTVLVVLVLVARRMRNNSPDHGILENVVKAPEVDDDIELSMVDDPVPGSADETMVFEVDEAPPDQLNEAVAHQFDIDDKPMEDIDDMTIPKVGEAAPPRKGGLFSASWLRRERKEETVPAPPDMATTDARTIDSAAECSRLAEIERNMLALRELYEAGLIAPEVYVLKAREFAGQSG
ncbi:MAG: hypothetical protein CML95_01095 [Rhodobiaceae bacterium]|nr:hypothetical protein [Rhodobiaceae bacterium]